MIWCWFLQINFLKVRVGFSFLPPFYLLRSYQFLPYVFEFRPWWLLRFSNLRFQWLGWFWICFLWVSLSPARSSLWYFCSSLQSSNLTRQWPFLSLLLTYWFFLRHKLRLLSLLIRGLPLLLLALLPIIIGLMKLRSRRGRATGGQFGRRSFISKDKACETEIWGTDSWYPP